MCKYYKTLIFQSHKMDTSTLFIDTAVGVAVVLVWRGVWLLADVYVFPGEERRALSGGVCALVGLATLVAAGALPREW